jgi:hypothetical protein
MHRPHRAHTLVELKYTGLCLSRVVAFHIQSLNNLEQFVLNDASFTPEIIPQIVCYQRIMENAKVSVNERTPNEAVTKRFT